MSHKVLFVQSQTEIGGAEVSLLTELRAMDRRTVEPAVAVLGFGAGHYPKDLRASGIETFELHAGRLRNPLAWAGTVLRLAGLVRRGGFLTVVANGYHPALYSHPAARLAGARSIIFCRDMPKPRGEAHPIERLAFRLRADGYIVASAAMRAAVEQRIAGRAPVHLVPHGVRLERLRPESNAEAGRALRRSLGWDPEHLAITCPGRLQPGKGQSVFLEAAAVVAREVPEARFLVVGGALFGKGEDYAASLREQVGRLGLTDRVIFTGQHEDMPAVYAASDVVVHASIEPEGFGLVVAEALAAGRALVASPAGGAGEIFEPGRSALDFEPGNAAALAEKLVRLCRDPDLRRRLGEAGRRRAEELYSPEAAAQRLAGALIDLETTAQTGAGTEPAHAGPRAGRVTRLAVLTGTYPPQTGGVADYSRLLAGALAERGSDVIVMTTAPGESAGGTEPFPVRRLADGWTVAGAWRTAKALACEGKRTVLFQYVPHLYARAGLAPGAALLPLFCRLRSVPVITVFHEVCLPWSAHPARLAVSVLHRLQAFLLTIGSRAVVFSNRRDAREFPRPAGLLGRPWEVLASGPSGPAVELSAEQRAAERGRWATPGEALAVFYGLASRSKRLDLALEALRLLRAEGRSLRLLMLGDLEAGDRDYCRELRARAASLGVAPFVTWSGPRPAEEVSRALASADFMWHLERGGITTRNATAALALANGLPVVALSGDSLDGPFRDGENVLLVGEPSARALAAAAARVLDSPELARGLRTGGRRLYETVFAWPVIVEGYLRLMERAKLC